MGRRGPKPTPTSILKLRGSRWANRPNEPIPPDSEIRPPSWLTQSGRAVWDQMAPICLAMGTLTVADVNRFARYCNAHGAYQASPESYDVGQFSTLSAALAKYEAQFGLGPADRANLKVERKEEKPTKQRFFKCG